MKPKTNPDDKISLNKKQVRTILFWLDTANSKYYGGSHRDIVEVFELLARFCNDLRNSKVKWKWKPSHELTEYDLLKRQIAEQIFKDLAEVQENFDEIQFAYRFDERGFDLVKQKYLQNHNGTTIQEDTVHNGVCGISCSNDEHNQERDSDSSDNKLESRPDVLKVSNAKELVETLKDNNNKEIVFIEEGCHKIVGKFPYGNVPARCGDSFDSETILCEDCNAKQKAQGNLE